jgi:formylglycine-generating enzyme required for sulfatase activity
VAKWPASNAVDSTSCLGKLRSWTGLDFDLPTEAQWEYACRAGTTTTYSYGNSANGSYMWYGDNSSWTTHEVGTKQPNPWGLYDMHGNVFEWCLDWYGTLSYGTDPKGSSSGASRMLRGGCLYCGCSYFDVSFCASSYRIYGDPPDAGNNVGFRLARVLNQ